MICPIWREFGDIGEGARVKAPSVLITLITPMAVFAHTQRHPRLQSASFLTQLCHRSQYRTRHTARAHARVQKGHRAAALSLSSYFLNAKPHSTQILQFLYEEWPFGQSM